MRGWAWYGAVLALGAVLYLLCRLYPADLPFWLPWEFSWPEYLITALAFAWFLRGLKMPKRRRKKTPQQPKPRSSDSAISLVLRVCRCKSVWAGDRR